MFLSPELNFIYLSYQYSAHTGRDTDLFSLAQTSSAPPPNSMSRMTLQQAIATKRTRRLTSNCYFKILDYWRKTSLNLMVEFFWGWLPCWPLYSQQVSHQRWIWGSHKQESMQKWIHSGFETQGRHHQKSKTGVSEAPRNELMSSKNFKKRKNFIEGLLMLMWVFCYLALHHAMLSSMEMGRCCDITQMFSSFETLAVCQPMTAHVEQESPPAWTQETHRPPRSKYSLCCSV